MEPTISVKNVRLTPRIETYVSKKTSRLDRYMPNMAELHIDLSKQRVKNADERSVAQITVRDSKGTILRAEDQQADVFAAIDIVVDKIYRQIKRYRDKRVKNRRGNGADIALLELEALPIEEDDTELDYKMVRQKRFEMQPMSPDEAIDQMELLGHDFYVFYNTDESAVNVVYRRRDEDYGLLQPEIG